VKRYTLSLHEKANLRRELETWRGKKFTAEEGEGFDLEKLLGANCQLQVIHNEKDDGTVYANVQAIVPAGRGLEKLSIPPDYVRAINRDKTSTDSKPGTNGKPAAQPTDRLVNHEEMTAFWTAVKSWGWTSETVHEALASQYGLTSVKDITKSKLDKILTWFKESRPAASKPDPASSEPWPEDEPITDADVPF
jgi:hypothetical protein